MGNFATHTQTQACREQLRARNPNREARLFDAVLGCLDRRWGVDRDRVYTVGFRATDDAGNATEGMCTVVVRHDASDMGPVQANVEAYRIELGGCG